MTIHARLSLLPAVALAALLPGCSHGPAPAATAAASTTAASPVAAFETVRLVLQDPRCQNCHPAADRPLQGDDSRVHTMNVVRGPDGHGTPGAQCVNCHGKANPPESYGAHQPPGVSSDWHLPPPDMKMTFVGRSSRELCEQLKDPARNGNANAPRAAQAREQRPARALGLGPGRRPPAGRRAPRRVRRRVQALGGRRRFLPALSGLGSAAP